jgi:hypothetical protein
MLSLGKNPWCDSCKMLSCVLASEAPTIPTRKTQNVIQPRDIGQPLTGFRDFKILKKSRPLTKELRDRDRVQIPPIIFWRNFPGMVSPVVSWFDGGAIL